MWNALAYGSKKMRKYVESSVAKEKRRTISTAITIGISIGIIFQT